MIIVPTSSYIPLARDLEITDWYMNIQNHKALKKKKEFFPTQNCSISVATSM